MKRVEWACRRNMKRVEWACRISVIALPGMNFAISQYSQSLRISITLGTSSYAK